MASRAKFLSQMNSFFLFFKNPKSFILIGLILFLLQTAGLALALEKLENNYPSLPGISSLNNAIEGASKLNSGQKLGFYAKYLINFFFFVAAGVCVVVLITAGILYLTASQKPAIISQAREMAQRAFLGLFIIVCSNLILRVINPDLLIFNPSIKPLSGAVFQANLQSPVPSVTVTGVDTAAAPKKIMAKLEEKVLFDPDSGKIIEKDAPIKPPKTEEVMVAELPFVKVTTLLDQASQITAKLNILLPYCQCGKSFSHLQQSGVLDYRPLGGLNPLDTQESLSRYLAIPQDQRPYSENQAVCLTQADNCGTKSGVIGDAKNPLLDPNDEAMKGALACDLREVRKIPDSDPVQYEFEQTPGKWVSIDSLPLVSHEKDGLIKYQRLKVQEIIGKLEIEEKAFNLADMNNLDSTLRQMAVNFLSGNVQEGMFLLDFEKWKSEQEQQGVNIVVEFPERFSVPENPLENPLQGAPVAFNLFQPKGQKFFSAIFHGIKNFTSAFYKPKTAFAIGEAAASLSSVGPATLFYPILTTNNPALALQWKDVLTNNQYVDKEAKRANIFSVLAGLSLEQIDQIFNDCLTKAFGQASYDVSQDAIAAVIQGAVGQGISDYFLLQLAKNSPNFATLIGDKIKEAINEEADGQLKKKCQAQCAGSSDADCVDKCVKANIPPHFLSNKVAEFFTRPIYERLPGDIPKILNEPLKNYFFSATTQKYYIDDPSIIFYKDIVGLNLQKSYLEMMPELKEALQTKIGDWAHSQSATATDVLSTFVSFKIEDLVKKFFDKSEEGAKVLTNIIDTAIGNEAEKLKNAIPGLSPQTRGFSDCQADYENGYVFIKDSLFHLDDPDCQAGPCLDKCLKGECRKMTPEEVNLGVGQQVCLGGDIGWPLNRETGALQQICEKLHYHWTTYGSISNLWKGAEELLAPKCVENQNLPISELADLDARQIGRAALSGAIDYLGEFLIALTETTMHTAMAFAQVMVEDEILQPMEPYLQQVGNFQDSLKKFMNSTVADILPRQIVGALNSNVDNTLAFICSIAQKEDSEVELDLYSQKTYGGKLDIEVPQGKVKENVAWGACHLSKHLHTTFLKELEISGDLGKKISDGLQSKIIELLPKNFQEFMTQTPAELLFGDAIPDKAALAKIIKGTPKDMLCGDLAIMREGDKWTTPGSKCDALAMPQTQFSPLGSLMKIPYLDTDKLNAIADPKERKALTAFCPFYWGFCRDVTAQFSVLSAAGKGKVGEVIADFIDKSCQREAAKAAKLCQGKCIGNFNDFIDPIMKQDLSCPTDVVGNCFYCNFLKKPAFSMLLSGIFNTDPEIGALANRTNQGREKEMAIYEWLLVNFSQATAPLIQQVATERGITSVEWQIILKKQRDLKEINSLSEAGKPEGLLKTLVLNCKDGISLANFILQIPDGIIKPTEPGKAALLRKAGEGERLNFLSHSGQDLLFTDICGAIKTDFKQQYPQQTIEAIYQKGSQQSSNALPYSMQSLERYTKADALQELLNSEAGVNNIYPYAACVMLDMTPAEIFGIDQNLLYYLRPKEYQILFELINNELMSNERPQALNDLLGYLYNETPTGLMLDINNKLLEGTPDKNIQAIGSFLTSPLKSTLISLTKNGQKAMQKRLIDILSDQYPQLNNVFSCKQFDASILGKSPLDWLKEANFNDVPDWTKYFCWGEPGQITAQQCQDAGGVLQAGKCCSTSFMAIISKFVPVLGEPYVDTIGKFTRIDEPLFNLFEWKQDVNKQVNQWVEKGQTAIQGGFDQALIEAPEDASSYIGNRLASLFGDASGKALGDKLAGSGCRAVDDSSKCQANEAFREGNGQKECCDLGQPFVCDSRCYLKGADNCKTEKGEVDTLTNGQHFCCLEKAGDNKCKQCRSIPADEYYKTKAKCQRQGETKDVRGLCCKEIALINKELYGPADTGAQEFCCTTVIDCVTQKFLGYMEILQEYMVNGLPPY
ncbi:MAG: pilin [Candidatus Pacebacteria bacterium]|nr:pilin [Candidatus Paceibacterota bacterium]